MEIIKDIRYIGVNDHDIDLQKLCARSCRGMSNDKLAGNTNGNGFVRCPRLGNRVLEHLASTLMQIESNGRELVVCHKIIERIVDAHHAHVLGHAQTAIAQRCNRAISIWSFAA